jgi:hypothetical protein
MTDPSKGFLHYPAGLKFIITFMLLNSVFALISSRNFFGAATSLILGVGLLKLKNWAREWLMFLIVLGLIALSIKTIFDMTANRLHNSDLLAVLIYAPLLGNIFFYLRSPAMKELFLVEPSRELHDTT